MSAAWPGPGLRSLGATCCGKLHDLAESTRTWFRFVSGEGYCCLVSVTVCVDVRGGVFKGLLMRFTIDQCGVSVLNEKPQCVSGHRFRFR